jgi:PAS domain S-box-containing protein
MATRKTKAQLEQEVAELRQYVDGLPPPPPSIPSEIARVVARLEQEIAERRRAEDASLRHEGTVRALIDAITETAFIMDCDGIVLAANLVAAQRLGKNASQLEGICIYDLLPPDTAAHRKQYVHEVVRTGRPARFEDERRGRIFDNSIYPILDDQGQVTRIAIFGFDITERTQMEQALRASEAQYRLLAENATDVIWTVDMNMRPTYFSPSITRLTGYSIEEAMSHSMEGAYTPESLARATQALAEELADEQSGKRPSGRARLIELWLYHKDGHTVPAEVNFSFLRDATMRPTSILAIARDITERKRAEEKLQAFATELERSNRDLQQSNADLHARNEELDAFAHTVAHDLKQPLSVILGYAEVLAEDHTHLSAQEIRNAHRSVAGSSHKMVNIIDELLLLASVRKAEVEVVPLEMDHIVEEALTRLDSLIASRSAEIALPAVWPPTLGHASWVEEVWVNYLSNGIQYGGRPPHLWLSAQAQPDGMVRFAVRDDGPGLTPTAQARLFTPFTRLGQAHPQGHGLGLSIVRRIVEKLGGRAGVESAGVPGQGSIFYFLLPGVIEKKR